MGEGGGGDGWPNSLVILMYSWTTLRMFLLVMSSYIGHPFNKISILTYTSIVDIDCALILLYLLQCNK